MKHRRATTEQFDNFLLFVTAITLIFLVERIGCGIRSGQGGTTGDGGEIAEGEGGDDGKHDDKGQGLGGEGGGEGTAGEGIAGGGEGDELEGGEDNGSKKKRHFDYIIVGAGPSGLQLGYFLKRAKRDYVVLERANISGSFFTIYPRHDRLISINKRHTGRVNKEFNLRHDWNSLISDDVSLNFGLYSREFFPHRTDYVRYLNDYQRQLGINVLYSTDVHDIRRLKDGGMNDGRGAKEAKFQMRDLRGNIFTCSTLIVATGMWKPALLGFRGAELMEGYESVSTNPEDFEGQSILIIGRGNAAFEVADRIYGTTNHIHLIGRSRVRLSWSTHYVGDLRGVNNAVLDTYQLKSLDAILEGAISDQIIIEREGNKLVMSVNISGHEHEVDTLPDNIPQRRIYDRIIRCLGFRFDDSLFAEDDIKLCRGKGRKSKYPSIGHNYESRDVPGLFFAGTTTHSLDFRKSAGGFVHGFRYTARALHNLLEVRNHDNRWPAQVGHVTDLLAVILKRINEASGLYQMFGMLCDVIAIRGNNFEYFQEFPLNLLHEFEKHSGTTVSEVIIVSLEYGANFSGPAEDTFRVNRAIGDPSIASQSNFLHPVFYYYKHLPTEEAMMSRKKWETLPRPDRLHHIVEDVLAFWDAPISHVTPLRVFLEMSLSQDLRAFYAEDCLVLAMTHTALPLGCQRPDLVSRLGVNPMGVHMPMS